MCGYADVTLRNLKSALEAEVVITLPSETSGLGFVELLRREGKHDSYLDRNFTESQDPN